MKNDPSVTLDELFMIRGNRAIKDRLEWCQEVLSLLCSNERGIYMWGTGNVARAFYKEIKALGAHLTAFVDGDSQKQSCVWLDKLPVISPTTLSKTINPLVIIGTAMYSREIFDQLSKFGIKDIIDAMDFRLNFMFEDIIGVPIDEIHKKCKMVMEFLWDDESKIVMLRHLISFFDFQKGFNRPVYYHDLYRLPQYFPEDIVNFTDKDVLVDCGAYTGDTLASFLAQKKQFAKYICYELSKKNYIELQSFIKKRPSKAGTGDILTYNLGVGDKESIIFYEDSDMETKCLSSGTEGYIVKLSNHLAKEKVSFIKMDLEGMELAALMGAEDLIKKNHPRLAVCVYHKISDFWEIPLYMKQLNKKYRLYMRQHTPHWPETVCYAV